jgi:hypothetical protein
MDPFSLRLAFLLLPGCLDCIDMTHGCNIVSQLGKVFLSSLITVVELTGAVVNIICGVVLLGTPASRYW